MIDQEIKWYKTIEKPSGWYKFDDKCRHLTHESILCYNAVSQRVSFENSNNIDEYGYDRRGTRAHYTHWMPIIFPR